ncbi:MAG: type 1 glutamine amidotransferase domain-containing protein [Sarcina sp.]
MKKILLVSTSHNDMNGHPTGLWLEELAEPYNIFKEVGFELEIASIKGGEVPIDVVSIPEGVPAEYEHVMPLLKTTKKLEDVLNQDFDAVVFAGGHGPLEDFTNTKSVSDIILKLDENDKVVAGVCHGLSAFLNVKTKDGKDFIDGKKLTGFTNTEEDLAQLSSLVPYALETELVKQGAKFERAGDFVEYVVVDNNFITGQNPQSSHKMAVEIVNKLK